MKIKETFWEFFRYCIVGGVAFLADFGALVAAQEMFLKHFIGGIYVSTVIGFIIGLAVNYVLSLLFVFTQEKDKGRGQCMARMLLEAYREA